MANKDDLPKGITIRPRADGIRYRVRVRHNNINHECGEYRKLTVARQALAKYREQVDLGVFVPPAEQRRRMKEKRLQQKKESLTLKEWAKQWLDLLETGDITPMDPKPRSAGTITSYKSILDTHIYPTMEHRPLVSITGDEIKDVVAAAREHGTGAARNTARTLSALMNAAVQHKVPGMTSSPYPADLVVTKSRRRKPTEIPTLEEALKIAALMGDYGLAVELAVFCQLRVGEVLGLQRQDLKNLERPGQATLTVQRQWASKTSPPSYQAPKDESYRTVVLPAALAPKVQAHLDDHVLDDPQAPVFPSTRDKARTISHNALAARWKEARDQVKPGTSFHSLRHLGLTLYAQLGATTAEVMARGGHRDQDAAARYQHAFQGRDIELADKLNNLIEEK